MHAHGSSLSLFSSFQLHERHFSPHLGRLPSHEQGSFVVDKYIGRDTRFHVFGPHRESGFLRSITVQDHKGHQYRGIAENLHYYNIFSSFNVPFQEV